MRLGTPISRCCLRAVPPQSPPRAFAPPWSPPRRGFISPPFSLRYVRKIRGYRIAVPYNDCSIHIGMRDTLADTPHVLFFRQFRGSYCIQKIEKGRSRMQTAQVWRKRPKEDGGNTRTIPHCNNVHCSAHSARGKDRHRCQLEEHTLCAVPVRPLPSA